MQVAEFFGGRYAQPTPHIHIFSTLQSELNLSAQEPSLPLRNLKKKE
jgi:hypothetical protein